MTLWQVAYRVSHSLLKRNQFLVWTWFRPNLTLLGSIELYSVFLTRGVRPPKLLLNNPSHKNRQCAESTEQRPLLYLSQLFRHKILDILTCFASGDACLSWQMQACVYWARFGRLGLLGCSRSTRGTSMTSSHSSMAPSKYSAASGWWRAWPTTPSNCSAGDARDATDSSRGRSG